MLVQVVVFLICMILGAIIALLYAIIHELGHFTFARLLNLKSGKEIWIGMPKKFNYQSMEADGSFYFKIGKHVRFYPNFFNILKNKGAATVTTDDYEVEKLGKKAILIHIGGTLFTTLFAISLLVINSFLNYKIINALAIIIMLVNLFHCFIGDDFKKIYKMKRR